MCVCFFWTPRFPRLVIPVFSIISFDFSYARPGDRDPRRIDVISSDIWRVDSEKKRRADLPFSTIRRMRMEILREGRPRRRRRRATEIFAIRRRLYRAGASVMRFKDEEGARGSRTLPRKGGLVKERRGKRGGRPKVSVLRPCGIRPPLRAHDSRKSLRLGIVHRSQPVDRCSESAVEIDEERGLKEIIDCGHY